MFGTVHSVPGLVIASVLTGVSEALFHPASYASYAALTRGTGTPPASMHLEMVSNLGFVVGPVVSLPFVTNMTGSCGTSTPSWAATSRPMP